MNNHPEPEQLSAYVDGELDGRERDDLEQHLTGCSVCSATVRAIRATLADMRALPTPAPSEKDSWALRVAISKARKRPAARYRAWVAAAGVAAGIIALVVVTNGRTASSTFSHTGTSVIAGGAEGARAPAAAPSVEILDDDFSSSSAASFLASSAPAPATAAQPTPSPKSETGSVAGVANGPTYNYDALVANYTSQIQTCERKIFSRSSRPMPYRYVVATYEKTPAFFLVYALGDKLEMYVVQRKDCYIRLFLAPR